MNLTSRAIAATVLLAVIVTTGPFAGAYMRTDDSLWDDGGGSGGGTSGSSGTSAPPNQYKFADKDSNNIVQYNPLTHAVTNSGVAASSDGGTEKACTATGCTNHGGKCYWVRGDGTPRPWWMGPYSETDFTSGYCTSVHLQTVAGEGAIADFRAAIRGSSALREAGVTVPGSPDSCFPHGCFKSNVLGDWKVRWTIVWTDEFGDDLLWPAGYAGPALPVCVADPSNPTLKTVYRDLLAGTTGMDFITCVWDAARVNVQYSYDHNLTREGKLAVGGYRVYAYLDQTKESGVTENVAWVRQACTNCLALYRE